MYSRNTGDHWDFHGNGTFFAWESNLSAMKFKYKAYSWTWMFVLLLKGVFWFDSGCIVCLDMWAAIHRDAMLLWDVCTVYWDMCIVTWCLSRTSLYLTALSGRRFQCGVTAVADLLSLVTPHFPYSHTAPACLTALQHTRTHKHTHITWHNTHLWVRCKIACCFMDKIFPYMDKIFPGLKRIIYIVISLPLWIGWYRCGIELHQSVTYN